MPKPNIVKEIAEITVLELNKKIRQSTVLTKAQKDLAEVLKNLHSLMTAIEQGIITKTTQVRLVELECEKERLENVIAIEKSRTVQPLQVKTVKDFLMHYALKEYNSGKEKNEFFHNYIYKIVMYDEYVCIFYNLHPETGVQIPSDTNGIIENNSFEPERVVVGGEIGI